MIGWTCLNGFDHIWVILIWLNKLDANINIFYQNPLKFVSFSRTYLSKQLPLISSYLEKPWSKLIKKCLMMVGLGTWLRDAPRLYVDSLLELWLSI